MTIARPTLLYRLGVTSRIAAALGGSYTAAALLAVLLALTLPMPAIDRTVAGALVAIAALPFLAILCFWVRSALRAWAVMAMLCALLAARAWLAGWSP